MCGYAGMKALTVYALKKRVRDRSWFFLLAPVGSAGSLAASSRATPDVAKQLLGKSFRYGWIVGFLYWLYWKTPPPPGIVRSYCCLPIIMLFGEAVGPVMQISYFPTGKIPPAHHDRPWLAKSLQEFWGRRWNTWFSDICRTLIFRPLGRWPLLAMIGVFLFSGIIHELLINLPFHLSEGKALYGSQILFFALQAFGIWFDRTFLSGQSWIRRFWAWGIVTIPAPLILNEGALKILGLWPS